MNGQLTPCDKLKPSLSQVNNQKKHETASMSLLSGKNRLSLKASIQGDGVLRELHCYSTQLYLACNTVAHRMLSFRFLSSVKLNSPATVHRMTRMR